MPTPVPILVQLAAGSFAKRTADGRLDYPSPVPHPFDYGEVEGSLAPDGMPLDVVILGVWPAAGARIALPIWDGVDFQDDGCDDPKLIAAPSPPSPLQRAGLIGFFAALAAAKSARAILRGRPGRAQVRGWLGAESCAALLSQAPRADG